MISSRVPFAFHARRRARLVAFSRKDDEDMREDEDTFGNGSAAEHPWMNMDGPPWLENAQDMAERARVWVVSNPFAAIGAALAAGFLFGRVAKRLG
jgi:hypothetical protein